MRVTIKERHVEVTDTVKAYARDKAGKLDRFYDRVKSIQVILDGDEDQAMVEMIAKIEGTETVVGHHLDKKGDFMAAIDVVLEKMESQLRKLKEKNRNRKHLATRPSKQ